VVGHRQILGLDPAEEVEHLGDVDRKLVDEVVFLRSSEWVGEGLTQRWTKTAVWDRTLKTK